MSTTLQVVRTLPSVIQTRCHYCSKFRHPSHCIHIGQSVVMCLGCYEWHQKALKMLCEGIPPSGCQSCGITFEALFDHAGNNRMYVHVRDGIYQILCRSCSDTYVLKRKDLYGATAFGHRKGL